MNCRFVTFVLLLILFLVGNGLQQSPPLYRKIQIVGVTTLTEEDLNRLIKLHPLRELTKKDVRILARELREYLPVQEVVVERLPWERTLRIELKERQPFISFVSDRGHVLLLDEEGNLATYQSDPEMILWDRPILRGCTSQRSKQKTSSNLPSPSSEFMASPASTVLNFYADADPSCIKKLVAFSRLIAAESPQDFQEFSEIIGEKHEIRLILNQGVILSFLPYSYLLQLRGMLRALAEAQERGLKVRSLLMPRPGMVILRIQSSSGPPTMKTQTTRQRERRRDHEA